MPHTILLPICSLLLAGCDDTRCGVRPTSRNRVWAGHLLDATRVAKGRILFRALRRGLIVVQMPTFLVYTAVLSYDHSHCVSSPGSAAYIRTEPVAINRAPLCALVVWSVWMSIVGRFCF